MWNKAKTKRKFEIDIISIKNLNDFDINEHTAVIYCSSYTERLNKPKIASNWLTMELVGKGDAFASGHSELIKSFIDTLNPQIKKIIICTDRAESRAPAVAAAITRYIGESDISFWRNYKYHPNVNVFNRLCKSFNVYMPKIAISYRVFINKYALRKQINKSRK